MTTFNYSTTTPKEQKAFRDWLTSHLKYGPVTVDFVKKDGTTRTMNSRLGVTRYLKGGELPYDPAEKGLLPVFDAQKGEYRMINIPTIISAKIGNEEYIAS